jgi:hypothetical protein
LEEEITTTRGSRGNKLLGRTHTKQVFGKVGRLETKQQVFGKVGNKATTGNNTRNKTC